ncbi:MAG: KilA-N domain-containing protein [Rhodospirillaceae bacterium]|nr:MAG: KilA-N domain-containing protein [Rhodospirillaceae bacterium]
MANANISQSTQIIKLQSNGQLIYQRASDGYVSATALCKAAGKLFADYTRLDTTRNFINALSSDMGIPISSLIQQVKGTPGGDASKQGSWVHPKVAIHLAQWLSPDFSVQVTNWIFDWMSGKSRQPQIPYHLRRYTANHVPHTHFSILQMLCIDLIQPLERQGYELPEEFLPDISEGRMFAKWLREQGINTDALPTYTHVYEDGRRVQARLYPIALLPAFKTHFHQTWLVERAHKYFAERDAKALPHLTKVLAIENDERKRYAIAG